MRHTHTQVGQFCGKKVMPIVFSDRRIFNKITYDSYKHLRSRYFNVEYKERHQILSNYSGHPQMQKNVYQRIRKMADAGKSLDFPPIDLKYCLCKDVTSGSDIKASALLISKCRI